MMQYKGYPGVVQYDDEAKIFHGEVVDTRATITFQGHQLTRSSASSGIRSTVSEVVRRAW